MDKEQRENKVTARPVNLVETLAYQDNSVVSRTLIDRKADSLTVFAFDCGQGLSEHTAPFHVIVYLLDGKATITVAGETVEVKAGEILILPAGKPHALQAVEKFRMMLVMIRSQSTNNDSQHRPVAPGTEGISRIMCRS